MKEFIAKRRQTVELYSQRDVHILYGHRSPNAHVLIFPHGDLKQKVGGKKTEGNRCRIHPRETNFFANIHLHGRDRLCSLLRAEIKRGVYFSLCQKNDSVRHDIPMSNRIDIILVLYICSTKIEEGET